MSEINPFKPKKTLTLDSLLRIYAEAFGEWFAKVDKPYLVESAGQTLALDERDLLFLMAILRSAVTNNAEDIEAQLKDFFKRREQNEQRDY